MPILFYVNACNKYTDDLARENVANYIARAPEFLIGGYGVNLQNPALDMKRLAESFGKDSRKRLHHFILAFSSDDKIYPAQLQCRMNYIAAEIGQVHQVFYGIHTDTKHLHVHMMINAVKNDGYKFGEKWADIEWVRGIVAKEVRWLSKEGTRLDYKHRVPQKYIDYLD